MGLSSRANQVRFLLLRVCVGPAFARRACRVYGRVSRTSFCFAVLHENHSISRRIAELSLTSALCKSLYSDNITLKTKHEALLARLPSAALGSTPTASQPTSPRLLEPPSFHLSPSYASNTSGVTFPLSPDDGPLRGASALSRNIRRTRRISVTPSELASLSDQNAELIDKLEQLESESLKADQAGKRKLRKLEQEIQDLRDELERSQARGVELEEQARVAAIDVAAIQQRKEERDARLQALREKATVADPDDAEEVRDFAPSSAFSARTSSVKRSVSSSSSITVSSNTPTPLSKPSHDRQSYGEEPPDEHRSYFPIPSASSGEAAVIPEYAIVAQLLAKVRELEETNTQISEQQKLTEERMRAAQWDAESIRRVYDCLDDGDIDLEIQEEDEDSSMDFASPPVHSNGTIRFSSLRRSIAGDMSRVMSSDSDVFADGIMQNMQSTVRDGHTRVNSGHKARKSLVGLFDSGLDSSMNSSTGWGEYPPALKVSPAFRPNPTRNDTAWSSSATEGLDFPSPILSTMQLPLKGVGQTLGSELGSEFGDDWQGRGINHHLRASSLFDLANLSGSSPASPNESIAALPAIMFPTVQETSEDGWDPTTPPRAPQLTIVPPTPSSADKLCSPSAVRQIRLSQTVRARTNRWVEGRIVQTPSHAPSPAQLQDLREDSPSQALRKRSSVTLGRRTGVNALASAGASALVAGVASTGLLGETFDRTVGQLKRVASRGSFSPLGLELQSRPNTEAEAEADSEPVPEAQEEEGGEADRSITLRHDPSLADPLDGKREGVIGFVLEAWLWLQFIIVIALFLWAMAKRGPKVVLEAERRNAQRANPRS